MTEESRAISVVARRLAAGNMYGATAHRAEATDIVNALIRAGFIKNLALTE